ncbi:unnamed protein product [Auanema sp. JU1783]|nr:unnamed protein product [Auanema sp. JU1783]
MKWTQLLLCIFLFQIQHLGLAEEERHLTTDDEGYVTVIQGFATQLQCILNTCSPNVVWYKDDTLIFNGTQLVDSETTREGSFKLQHWIDVDYEKTCTGTCNDNTPCADGSACVDNQCCACAKEEFTLVLKNLTFEDAGRYRCQIANESELLEFQVEIIESGLRGGFHENISYDHSQCCQERGISPLCRAMCKPSEMNEHSFDPTSCKTDDYKNFLYCATENGTRTHLHCCKTQLVPSFCYDFCSGDFKMLRRSHRLCLYYLPEIFECYNRAYLPFPEAPESIQVNAVEHDKLQVCWKKPPVFDSNKNFPVIGYTVSFKEVPNFNFLTGALGIPLLGSDYIDIGDAGDEGDYEESSESPLTRVKRGTHEFSIRKERSTIVLMTNDSETHTSAVREFNFQHVNTSDTCLTLTNLRSATRYVILVTARNDYGNSVPSARAIASTNVFVLKNNGTAPDAMACCKQNGVTKTCADKMCVVDSSLTSSDAFTLATSCRTEWPKVSPCIADQRNHTECCVRKKVSAECLPICAGSTDELSPKAVLCLTIDMQTVYTCMREGYETHPSAPVNVSVAEITESSVVVNWEEPEANSHLVETFTLFIRKNEHGAPVRQVFNAVSPHTELGLDADSEYTVSVQANSMNGESLPSTAIVFITKPVVLYLCPVGEPLLLSEGRHFICSDERPCPFGYSCSEGGDGGMYCCQSNHDHSDVDFQECCQQQRVSESCLSSCHFNATLPESCKGDLNKWVQCASEGVDHSRCCEQRSIPKECLTGCRHPFQVPDACFNAVPQLSACFAGKHSGSPSAVNNLEITLIHHDSATLSYEYFDDDVRFFSIEIYHNNTLTNSTNTTQDVIRLENLQQKTEYSVRVIAHNEVGSSPPSWNVTFTTLPIQGTDADRPKQPDGLHIVWNQGTRVNISWNPVTKRRNDENVIGPIDYLLYYVDSENSAKWTTIRLNNSWGVISDLKKDSLYSVYVTAQENEKSSRSSSVITLLAQHNSLGLPEPNLTFDPDHADSFYIAGDRININCSVNIGVHKNASYHIDLTAGNYTGLNEPGALWVSLNVTADSTLDTAACAVTDVDGRQNVNMKHILVKFGPVAFMDKEKIRAFDDQSAIISCTVKGFPTPSIYFLKDGKQVHKFSTRVKLVKMNTYKATLHIPNAKGNEGVYHCVASRNGTTSKSDKAELIISKDTLPVDPKFILNCCEEEQIQGDCLKACGLGSIPQNVGNCTKYAKSLLKCASDIRDHSDCCIGKKVPSQCLPLCSGDSSISNFDCSNYAVDIMACFVRGHESSPEPVTSLAYEVVSAKKIKVSWESSPPNNDFQYYAVYTRRAEDENQDYQIFKTLNKNVVLDVEEEVTYDIGVIAANAFGHSPLVFMDVIATQPEAKKSDSNSSFNFIVILLLICTFAVIAIIILGRRRELPAPIGKLIGRPAVPHEHPTVAFENPAYVSGNEVEIRGLGRPEWQNQDLQASPSDNSGATNDYRNGMRYSKLEST